MNLNYPSENRGAGFHMPGGVPDAFRHYRAEGEDYPRADAAGCGGLLIADWWKRCCKSYPMEHFPSRNMVTCWELSARSIPILLLNLSIRGIMGYVYHGDVLEGTVKQKYILLNRHDDTLAFSEIVKANMNDHIIQEK